MSTYGTYHLSDATDQSNPYLYEVQRDNNFEFLVTGVENLVRVDSDQTITNAQDTLKFSVVSAPIPMFTQQIIEIKRGNTIMKAAGVPTFSDGSIVVNDYIGADTKSSLMAWQQLSYNVKTEKVGRMVDYKKTCYLMEYTPDYKLVRTWKLLGCWVSGLQESEFSYENNGKKTITATITFDKAFMELPDEEE